jgi:hypothetical protein
MNFTDFITNTGKRINKEYFVNLIQVSKVDGKINDTELELLHKEGKKFGLTDPEIDKLINTESHNHYHAPYSLAEKFEHLYNVTVMVLADEVVTESEKKMIRKFAIEAGFNDQVVEGVLQLLLDGVARGEEEEKLLKDFKRKFL